MVRRSVKVLLSLLLSLVISAVFTFFSFTRLFPLIETGIYYPNLKAGAEHDTLSFSKRINDYVRNTIDRFQPIVQKDFVWRAFSSRQLDSDINERRLTFSSLLQEYPQLVSVRLIDTTGTHIHYSTLESDIASRSVNRITYKNLDQTERPAAVGSLFSPGASLPRLLWDGARQEVVFALEVRDASGKAYGAALFSMKREALENELFIRQGTTFRGFVILGDAGLLIDTSGAIALSQPSPGLTSLESDCLAVWKSAGQNTVSQTLLKISDVPDNLALFSVALDSNGYVGVLFPARRFEMGMFDKILILGVFYVTVFLIILLITNVKQDPIKVVATRMHKFQVEFLKAFFENKDRLDLSRWQKEIDTRRDEVKRYMKKGLKKITSSKEAEIDSYIIGSWNEVVSIIKSKVQKQPENDLSKIEMLLRKVLEEGRVFIAPAAQRAIGSAGSIRPAQSEARAETSAASTIEKPATSEEIPELEELEEIEPAAEAQPVEPSVPGGSASEDLEEIAALEELPAEPLPETALATDSATAPESVPVTAAGEDEILELEPIEEEITSPEPAPAARSAAGEMKLPREEAPVSETERSPATRSSDAGRGAEEIEYLNIVSEIAELPPLPFEELEELQAVDLEKKPNINLIDAFSVFETSIKKGDISVFSVKDAQKIAEQTPSNIIMRNGVYTINEALYASARPVQKLKGLKALAQSLLDRQQVSISSIDELYGNKEILADAEKKQIQENISLSRKSNPQQRKMPLTGRGMDLDAYMESFAHQVTDKVMIYAIGELIKKAKAVSSILFTDDAGLKVAMAIGVTSRSAHLFTFAKDEALYQEYFSGRNIIIIKDVFRDQKLFTSRLSSDDVKFIRSAVFFPATIEHKDAYLFFGMTENEGVANLETFMKKIDVILSKSRD